MKNTFFKNCKRFFVFVFDILSAIRREQLLSLSEGQRATALEAKGHRLSQVPRAERWGWRGGGAAARDEPPSLSLRHRERGGGKKHVSENMKTNKNNKLATTWHWPQAAKYKKEQSVWEFGKNVYFFSFQKIKTKTNNFKNLHEAIISLQMNKQVEITRR